MSNSNIQEQFYIERIYDDAIVGLGTTGAIKYQIKDRLVGRIMAYVVLEEMEELIYFPRMMSVNDSVRVLKLWESRRATAK